MKPRWRHGSRAASAEVVRKQAEVGIDIVNDGEFSKSSWASYFGAA